LWCDITEETAAASEDVGPSPSVVNMSRDPRRSRQAQTTNLASSTATAAAAAASVKTEPSKPSPSLKPEPSPREPVLMELAKSELLVKPEPPSTPKSPTATSAAPLVLPPLPAYQLWVIIQQQHWNRFIVVVCISALSELWNFAVCDSDDSILFSIVIKFICLFFSVNTIAHKLLHLACWHFAWLFNSTTARTLLNFKVVGQGHRIIFSDTSPLRYRALLLLAVSMFAQLGW